MPQQLARSYRLDLETLRLLDVLARREGLSQAAIIRLAVREMARRRRVPVQELPPEVEDARE